MEGWSTYRQQSLALTLGALFQGRLLLCIELVVTCCTSLNLICAALCLIRKCLDVQRISTVTQRVMTPCVAHWGTGVVLCYPPQFIQSLAVLLLEAAFTVPKVVAQVLNLSSMRRALLLQLVGRDT